MKKSLYTVLIFALSFILPSILFAAQSVDNFRALITVNTDGSISVEERIIYNFDTDQRHGIFRDILFKYKTSLGSYRANITDITVVDESGGQYIFEAFKSGNNIRVQIGDPDGFVSGIKTYTISYRVYDVISYFQTFDELYWNITGDEWSVPIQDAGGVISLPLESTETFGVSTCYKGPRGSTERCAQAEARPASSSVPATFVFLDGPLQPGEGLTVAVSFPKGLVYEPSGTERFIKFSRDNVVVLIPIVVLFIMLRLWFERGRDPRGRGTIVPQYEPQDELTPAEVGVIYDERVQNKDITAEIIHLAVLGYIKIHQIEKKKLIFTDTDYVLQKLKNKKELENIFDRRIISTIFKDENIGYEYVEEGKIEGVLLSSLKTKFQKDFKKIQKGIYGAVTDNGYFVRSPRRVVAFYAGVGSALFVVAWIVGSIFQIVLFAIMLGLSGAIIFGFAFLMPQRTKKGVLAKEYILGLKDYISVAEKDRLAFHNAPERTPEQFDKLLSYAMALGVEKEWAKQFEDIYTESPNWYVGVPGHSFNTTLFAGNLSAFNTAVSSNLAPSSSGGGGGGSSGGGFGGGGGGSW